MDGHQSTHLTKLKKPNLDCFAVDLHTVLLRIFILIFIFFVLAEWDFGGFPAWLLALQPPVQLRSSNNLFLNMVHTHLHIPLYPCQFLSLRKDEEDHHFTTAVSGIWKDIKFLSKPVVQEDIIMHKMPVQVDECFFFSRFHVAAMLLD